MSAHLCLGTAAWGAPYNGREPPSEIEIIKILAAAADKDVRWIDTAAAYPGAHQKIGRTTAVNQWNVVTKFKIADLQAPGGWEPPLKRAEFDLKSVPGVALLHMNPGEKLTREALASVWMMTAFGHVRLFGASVYEPDQAQAAMDYGALVLQVPWNMTIEKAEFRRWQEVQRRAYMNGVLFFGRQPFARGVLAQSTLRREAFQWALETNPRGWCVVGVEEGDQMAELLDWWTEVRQE